MGHIHFHPAPRELVLLREVEVEVQLSGHRQIPYQEAVETAGAAARHAELEQMEEERERLAVSLSGRGQESYRQDYRPLYALSRHPCVAR